MHCPHCEHKLSDEELFELLAEAMRLRTANCDHMELEKNPYDNTTMFCADCGTMVDQTVVV